jgi:hypothetical protein
LLAQTVADRRMNFHIRATPARNRKPLTSRRFFWILGNSGRARSFPGRGAVDPFSPSGSRGGAGQ